MHHHAGAGGPQGGNQSLSHHPAAEFGSAVSAGLNNHLNQQISNNQQNYIHNLASDQLLLINERRGQTRPTASTSGAGGPGSTSGGVSIIDQLSAAAAHGTNQSALANTASLFDDFPIAGLQQQQDLNPSSLFESTEDNANQQETGAQTNVIPNN